MTFYLILSLYKVQITTFCPYFNIFSLYLKTDLAKVMVIDNYQTILFVLFINDINSMVSAVDLFLSKFADDTKAARVVDTDEQAYRFEIHTFIK